MIEKWYIAPSQPKGQLSEMFVDAASELAEAKETIRRLREMLKEVRDTFKHSSYHGRLETLRKADALLKQTGAK